MADDVELKAAVETNVPAPTADVPEETAFDADGCCILTADVTTPVVFTTIDWAVPIRNPRPSTVAVAATAATPLAVIWPLAVVLEEQDLDAAPSTYFVVPKYASP